MLVCKDCGNTERFEVGVVEYHRWIIDGEKDYVEHDDLVGDCKMGDDYHCAKCDSWNVEDK